jgi:hypothetical protein
MPPSWLSPDPASPAHALIRVRAQPGARRTALVGLWNGCLKLAVSAPPDDGRANAALAELLAELPGSSFLAVPASAKSAFASGCLPNPFTSDLRRTSPGREASR